MWQVISRLAHPAVLALVMALGSRPVLGNRISINLLI